LGILLLVKVVGVLVNELLSIDFLFHFLIRIVKALTVLFFLVLALFLFLLLSLALDSSPFDLFILVLFAFHVLVLCSFFVFSLRYLSSLIVLFLLFVFSAFLDLVGG